MNRIAIAVMSLCFVTSSSMSQAQAINCDRFNSNVEIKDCLYKGYQASDRKLNQTWKRLTAKLAREEKTILTNAQLNWIKFRDQTCDFETYPNRGGTGYGGFLSQCLERVTQARTAQLEGYLRNLSER